jgi:FAD/FMN-containing dehydrogenase
MDMTHRDPSSPGPILGRRTMLQAGVLGVAALTSCAAGNSGRAAAGQLRPTRGGGALTAPPNSAWNQLARSLQGELVRPGDGDYFEAKELFNPRWDFAKPIAIVEAASAGDVSVAIDFARHWKLDVRTKSGGHSYVGASTGNGVLVISTTRMSWVRYNPSDQTVIVGSGARLYPVHKALAAHGRTIPTGTCPTVGAGGLTLGGGLGIANRQYGLTCDQLYSAEIVTADGVVRHANATTNPHLFWGLRGGGGGNFGIVTQFSYHTQPTTSLGFFLLTFPWSSAAAVIRGWSSRVTVMPHTTWANLHVEASSSGSTEIRVVGVCLPGHQASEAAAMESAVGVKATESSLFTKSYLDGVQFLGGGTTSPRQGWAAGSDVLPRMTVPASQAIVKVIADRAASGNSGVAILDPLTGAVHAKLPGGTAFPWRRHLCDIQWYLDMPDHPNLQQVHAAYTWIATAHKSVAGLSSGGYVNYLEPRRTVASYYGGNFARLQTLKRLWDPDNVFNGPFSIPA